MDKEQEDIQFLGFFGIFKESFHIITSWRKIFSQITTFMILPLSFIYLSYIQISHLLYTKGTPTYEKISDLLSSAWIKFLIFKIIYFIFLFVLSLLSTSAVIYTIACIYTAKDTTFKNVISVVPKVCKRLIFTLIWYSIILFAYHIVTFLAIVICLVLAVVTGLVFKAPGVFSVILYILCLIYAVGIVYISVVWHLASVVSVFEESYGLNAMTKGRNLIKGKTGISIGVFTVSGLFIFGLQLGFEKLVVHEHDIWIRICYGMISLAMISILILMELIIKTVIYFVCKSYHHENIDKSSLADRLEVYIGDYIPLTANDVHLRQF